MRRATACLLLSVACQSRPKTSSETQTPHAEAVAPPDVVCPFDFGRIDNPDLWPRCPVRPPVMHFGGLCPDAPGCMRPCRSRLQRREGDGWHTVLDLAHHYDEQGRLVESNDSSGGSPTPWERFEYVGAELRKVTLYRIQEMAVTFAYDSKRPQRARHTSPDGSFADRFEYDAAGRLSRVFLEGESEPDEVYEYDVAGRLVKGIRRHSGETTYEYEGDRLAKVHAPGVAGTQITTFTYRADGRVARVAKTNPPSEWEAEADPETRAEVAAVRGKLDATNEFRYDDNGMLVEIQSVSGTETSRWQYEYRCNDQR